MNYLTELYDVLKLIWIKNTRIRLQIIFSMIIVYTAAIGQIFIPIILKQIIDKMSGITPNSDLSLFIWLLFSYGIGWTICQLLPALRLRLTFGVIEHILIHIISNSINKFIDLDFMSNTKKQTGELIAMIERVQLAVANFLDGIFVQIIPVIIQIILAAIIITKDFGGIYSVLLISIIIAYFYLTKLSLDKSIQLRTKNNQASNNFINYTIDMLQHNDVVKYFNNETYEKQKINELLSAKKQSSLDMHQKASIFSALEIIIVGLGLTVITIISGKSVSEHTMTIGGFVLLNSYVMQFALPLSYIGYVVQAVKVSFVDLKDFINHTNLSPQNNIHLPYIEISNFDIEFKNVDFAYQEHKNIFENISFKLFNGEKLVILGKTGSGKSTLIKLLLGLIRPTNGTILLGGVDITTISSTQLMNIFGIIPQDCALFNRTVIENIRYGNHNASPEEIQQIIHLLQLEQINQTDIIGERSLKVSGGEKQRIALARLMLKKCQICIFDEFTSSLDIATEKKVLQLVNKLFVNKTRIIISHKLNVIDPADKILTINKGKITAFDTHVNLLAHNSNYYNRWHYHEKK